MMTITIIGVVLLMVIGGMIGTFIGMRYADKRVARLEKQLDDKDKLIDRYIDKYTVTPEVIGEAVTEPEEYKPGNPWYDLDNKDTDRRIAGSTC